MADRPIFVLRRDAPMAIRVPYSRHRYHELLPEAERTSSRLDTVEAVLTTLSPAPSKSPAFTSTFML